MASVTNENMQKYLEEIIKNPEAKEILTQSYNNYTEGFWVFRATKSKGIEGLMRPEDILNVQENAPLIDNMSSGAAAPVKYKDFTGSFATLYLSSNEEERARLDEISKPILAEMTGQSEAETQSYGDMLEEAIKGGDADLRGLVGDNYLSIKYQYAFAQGNFSEEEKNQFMDALKQSYTALEDSYKDQTAFKFVDLSDHKVLGYTNAYDAAKSMEVMLGHMEARPDVYGDVINSDIFQSMKTTSSETSISVATAAKLNEDPEQSGGLLQNLLGRALGGLGGAILDLIKALANEDTASQLLKDVINGVEDVGLTINKKTLGESLDSIQSSETISESERTVIDAIEKGMNESTSGNNLLATETSKLGNSVELDDWVSLNIQNGTVLDDVKLKDIMQVSYNAANDRYTYIGIDDMSKMDRGNTGIQKITDEALESISHSSAESKGASQEETGLEGSNKDGSELTNDVQEAAQATEETTNTITMDELIHGDTPSMEQRKDALDAFMEYDQDGMLGDKTVGDYLEQLGEIHPDQKEAIGRVMESLSNEERIKKMGEITLGDAKKLGDLFEKENIGDLDILPSSTHNEQMWKNDISKALSKEFGNDIEERLTMLRENSAFAQMTPFSYVEGKAGSQEIADDDVIKFEKTIGDLGEKALKDMTNQELMQTQRALEQNGIGQIKVVPELTELNDLQQKSVEKVKTITNKAVEAISDAIESGPAPAAVKQISKSLKDASEKTFSEDAKAKSIGAFTPAMAKEGSFDELRSALTQVRSGATSKVTDKDERGSDLEK